MAIQLNAVADRLTHTGSYPQPSGGVTITAWVRIDTDQNARTIFARLFDGSGTITKFCTNTDGTSGPAQGTVGGGTPSIGADMGALGVWVPVAATRTGGTAQVYTRAGAGATTTNASASITGVTATPTDICVGGFSAANTTEWLAGSMAYLRIWSTELTQSEIEDEWESTTPVRTANLHSNWPFTDATDLTDTVGAKTLAVQSGGALATVPGPAINAPGVLGVFDVFVDYGADNTGTSDAEPAIAAAIADADSIGGGTVWLQPGTYLIESALAAKSNVAIRGVGRDQVTIRAGASLTTALVLGTSGDAVTGFELSGVTLDGRYSVNADTLNGVQVTNGSRVNVHDCRFIDLGGAGVLLQGLSGTSGTPHSDVSDNLMDGIGLADGTTGFGILFKDSSTHCRAQRNEILNVKGGMGIGGNGSGGTGYPTHMTVSDNTIEMQNGTTDFEAIGLTAGCDFGVISDNNIVNSWDNGISYSAAHGTVTGNVIDGTRNHGIAIVGDGTAVTGNSIRNVGQQNDAAYGGITITGGGHCVIAGNVIIDDQGSSTTTHGVKLNSSAGSNLIGLNTISGHTGTAYTGAVTGDLVLDTTSQATAGFQMGRIYTDDVRVATSGQAGVTSSDWRSTSRHWVGSNSTSNGGQLNVSSNAGTTRPTASFNAVASQTQHLWQCLASDLSTVLAQCTITGRLVGVDGVTTRDLGNITGLTSGQIDALFSATPPNGTLATGTDGGTPKVLYRLAGVWTLGAGGTGALLSAANTFTGTNIFDGPFGVGNSPSTRQPITMSADLAAGGLTGTQDKIGLALSTHLSGNYTGLGGSNAGFAWGINNFVTVGSTAGDGTGLTDVIGALFEVSVMTPSGTTLPVVSAGQAEAAFFGSAAGATVTHMESFRVCAPKRKDGATAGTGTNVYGLFIESTDPADNDVDATSAISLFVEGGISRIQGRIDVDGELLSFNGSLLLRGDYSGAGTIELTTNNIGFFGATPVARPTGVAVSAAGIHAALVSLGLITA